MNEAFSDDDSDWGRVPGPVIDLIEILAAKAAASASAALAVRIPTVPSDIQAPLNELVANAHMASQAGVDIRSLLTAYAHRFHQPQPVLAQLALAQETPPQNIPRRYNNKTIDALKELLSPTPDVIKIVSAFRSLTVYDLISMRGPVGQAARLVTIVE